MTSHTGPSPSLCNNGRDLGTSLNVNGFTCSTFHYSTSVLVYKYTYMYFLWMVIVASGILALQYCYTEEWNQLLWTFGSVFCQVCHRAHIFSDHLWSDWWIVFLFQFGETERVHQAVANGKTWREIQVHVHVHVPLYVFKFIRPYQFNFMLLQPEDLSSRVSR